MPKQQKTISRFEGGLHTDADPRDIAENEFSSLQGFSVDSLGIIKMMGKHDNHSSITALTTLAGMNPGYNNIFAFSSEYSDGGALITTNYLAINEGSYVNIWDDGGTAFNAMNDGAVPSDGVGLKAASNSATETTQQLSFYAPNGNLRISDGYFATHANLVKWLGFITKKSYGKGTGTTASGYHTPFAQVDVGDGATVGGVAQDGWVAEDASVEGTLAKANLKMINLGDKTKGAIEGTSSGTDFIATVSNNAVTVTHAGVEWGNFTGSADDYYNGMTCSFNASGEDTIYGVVYDYNHDFDITDGGDENTHSTFYVWCGVDGDVTPATAIAATDTTDVTDWSFQVGQSDGYMWNSQFNNASHDQKVRGVTCGSSETDDFGLTLTFAELNSSSTPGGWMPTADTRYKFYHTSIYDDSPFGKNAQESLPQIFTMYPPKFAASETTHEEVEEIYFADGSDTFSGTGTTLRTAGTEVAVQIGLLVRMRSDNSAPAGTYYLGSSGYSNAVQDSATSDGTYNFNSANQRTRGGRIYYASSEDGYKNLFLLTEYDLEKGARTIGASGATSIGPYSKWKAWVYPQTTNPILRPDWSADQITFLSPPTIETYESLNLHTVESRLNAKWKTAVFANGSAYVGNVKRQAKSTFNGGGSWSSTTTDDPEYQDRILRSIPGQYDKFPEGPDFEFESSTSIDGDYIVKLETFADRMLVFKKYKLEILNITASTPTLEAEYKGLGLDGGYPVQAVSFGFGIAWMNSGGVYYYDGQKVNSLTDNKVRNMWVGEGYTKFWLSNASDIPAIAYDPKSKKIICAKTTTAAGSDLEDILVYSLKTKSWSYKVNALTDDKAKTFAIYKGDLIFDNGSRIQTWNDTPAVGTGSNGNIIYTKDYDFGAPGVRKNIKKVYITYKLAGPLTDATCDYNDDPTIAHDDDDGAIKKGMIVTGTGIPSNSYVDSVTSDTSFELNASTTGGSVTNGTLTFNGATNVQVKYGVNGDTTPTETFQDGTNFSSNELTSVDGWQVAELKPSTLSTAQNIYSFRLAFTCDNTVPAAFEINDITIVYKVKQVK